MSDFQSFLLQNMQLIGLEDEDDENDLKTSSNTKNTKSSHVSSSNSKYNTRESICIKSPVKKDKLPKKKFNSNELVNPSSVTTETSLSNSNLCDLKLNKNKGSSKNRDNFIDDLQDYKKRSNYHDDSNDNINSSTSSPKISKKKSTTLDDSNDYHLKSVGLFENNINKKKNIINLMKNSNNKYDFEIYNKNYNESSKSNSSDRDLSSPESILKNDFKSSTPIAVNELRNSKYQDSFKINNNYERVIKSPKPLKPNSKITTQHRYKHSSNESLNYRRVSSQKNKQKKRKTILDVSTSESINSQNNQNPMQTSFVTLRNLNDLNNNNEEYDNENNDGCNFSDENSIESTLMEPFLAKFERELLKSSKSDMIKDFKNFKQQNAEALTSKLKKQISDSKNELTSTSGHLFQRYLKEIKNLTVRRKGRKMEGKSSQDKMANLRPSLNLLDLRKLSKNQIPWNNLDIESADTLLGCIRVDESDDSNEETIFPDLYSKNGNKISKNQVKRWYEILKNLKDEIYAPNTSAIIEKNSNGVVNSPIKLNSSKKFFMNKKRQILDKVVLARKKSSTPKTSTKKISKDADDFVYSNFEEISHSVSKLYANEQIQKTKYGQIKQNVKSSNDSAASSMLSYSSSSSSSESESNQTDIKNEEISQYVNDNFNIQSAETAKKNNQTKSKEKPKVPPKIPPPPIIRPNNNDPNNFYNEIDLALNGNELKAKKQVQSSNFNENKLINKRNRENLPKTSQSSSAIDLAYKEIKIKESKQIFEKFFEALEQEQENVNTNKQKNSKSNVNKETPLTASKASISKLTHSGSAVSVVAPLPEFSEGKINSTSKAQLNSLVKLKSSDLLSKLKSPERKILYNEWFTIIKKMEKDPKFDLEALVRTRGRFTEHDNISYRDRLIETKQLRCARSEPNFSEILFSSQVNVNQEDTKNCKGRSNHIRTNKDCQKKSTQSSHSKESKSINHHRDITIKSESFSETIRRKWELESDQLNGEIKQNNQTLSNALKLTLQKSDINFIKEALKKKDKKIISELTTTRNGNRNNPKDSNSGQHTNDNRLSKPNRVKSNANDENENDSFDEHSSNSTKNIRKAITNSSKNLSESSKNNIQNRNHHHNKRPHRPIHHPSNKNTHQYTNKSKKVMEENAVCEEIEENNLMSKCKNLTNIYKSESAKAFRDVKGKIESKLKSLTNNSKMSSSMIKINSLEASSRKNSKPINVEKCKQPIRDLKIVHSTPRRDVKNSNHRSKKYSSEEEQDDGEIFRETQPRKTKSGQNLESPSRPAPPKRPPPPRPSSPATSFSNYSFSSFVEVNKHVALNGNSKPKINSIIQRKTQNMDHIHSISPQFSSANTKKETNNCQLPPRPPLPPGHSTSTSKLKPTSSKNSEDCQILSDCQIYEFEELKLRNDKKHVSNKKKNLDFIKEENSKLHRNKKMSNHSFSTPSLTLSSQSPSPDLPIEKPSRRNHSNQRAKNHNERKKS